MACPLAVMSLQEERVVAQIAMRTYDRYIAPKRLVSACYLVTFFLNSYLRRRHGIEGPFLTAYREGSFHYLLIAADRI